CHRYIHGPERSWGGRGDLGCAVDGERAGRVAAEPDRSRAGKIGAGDGYAGAPRRRTGIWIDVGNGRRRHIDELIRCSDGAGTALGGHRYINGTDPSWRGRGDLGCAVDGERAGRVAAEADRSRAGKIGAGDGYAGAPRRRTGIWIDVGDGRRAKLRLSFAFEANCA